ncbi:MAG: DUF998 domain-containing protein [Candidatus Hodarchaeota archaeon]
MSLDSLYEKLTDPKLTRFCIIIAFLIFIPGLIIAIIIAHFFGPTAYIPLLPHIIRNPGGIKWGRYSPWQNWISDLGSFRYTPAPFILDFILMSAGCLMIPVFFFLYEKFLPTPSKISSIDGDTKAARRFGIITTFCLVLGAIGAFGAGVFSEDRSYFGLHGVFSLIVFGGFAIGGLCAALVILLKDTFIPKFFGIIILCSPVATLLFAINPFNNLYILEWLMMFAIFAWIMPIAVIVLKEAKET